MKKIVQKTQKATIISLSNPKNVLIASLIILVGFLLWYRGDANPAKNTRNPIAEESCSLVREPVCGDDGKTYSNTCTAEKTYKVHVAHSGECQAGSAPSVISSRTDSDGAGSKAEVDSGIENLENVPKYSQERPEIVGTGALADLPPSDLTEYSSTALGYAFSMPKKSYYSAFGAQDGASHTIGISTGTGVESFAEASVRVYFYANKILDELKGTPNWFYTDRATGTAYVLLDGKSSVRIESDVPDDEVAKTIIRTVHLLP